MDLTIKKSIVSVLQQTEGPHQAESEAWATDINVDDDQFYKLTAKEKSILEDELNESKELKTVSAKLWNRGVIVRKTILTCSSIRQTFSKRSSNKDSSVKKKYTPNRMMAITEKGKKRTVLVHPVIRTTTTKERKYLFTFEDLQNPESSYEIQPSWNLHITETALDVAAGHFIVYLWDMKDDPLKIIVGFTNRMERTRFSQAIILRRMENINLEALKYLDYGSSFAIPFNNFGSEEFWSLYQRHKHWKEKFRKSVENAAGKHGYEKLNTKLKELDDSWQKFEGVIKPFKPYFLADEKAEKKNDTKETEARKKQEKQKGN